MIKFVTDALKNRDEEKGFSLVELIVVVAILGILVVVAIPVYGAIQETARHNALETAAANAATSVASALAQGGQVSDVFSDSPSGLNTPTGAYYYTINPATVFATPAGGWGTIAANTSTDDVYVYVQDVKSGDIAAAGTADGKWNTWG